MIYFIIFAAINNYTTMTINDDFDEYSTPIEERYIFNDFDDVCNDINDDSDSCNEEETDIQFE